MAIVVLPGVEYTPRGGPSLTQELQSVRNNAMNTAFQFMEMAKQFNNIEPETAQRFMETANNIMKTYFGMDERGNIIPYSYKDDPTTHRILQRSKEEQQGRNLWADLTARDFKDTPGINIQRLRLEDRLNENKPNFISQLKEKGMSDAEAENYYEKILKPTLMRNIGGELLRGETPAPTNPSYTDKNWSKIFQQKSAPWLNDIPIQPTTQQSSTEVTQAPMTQPTTQQPIIQQPTTESTKTPTPQPTIQTPAQPQPTASNNLSNQITDLWQKISNNPIASGLISLLPGGGLLQKAADTLLAKQSGGENAKEKNKD